MQWWPLKLIWLTSKPNNANLPLHYIPFWKCQTKDNTMVTFAADLSNLQTKPNNAYLSLHDLPLWKSLTKDNAMMTSTMVTIHIYPNMIYLFENARPRTIQWQPLQLIWVTSKPNQAMHIYPYMIYLLENARPDNAMVTFAANLEDLQTKPNNPHLALHDITFWKCSWFGWEHYWFLRVGEWSMIFGLEGAPFHCP